MILAIDVGNSTVGFGFFDGDKLAGVSKAETRRGRNVVFLTPSRRQTTWLH